MMILLLENLPDFCQVYFALIIFPLLRRWLEADWIAYLAVKAAHNKDIVYCFSYKGFTPNYGRMKPYFAIDYFASGLDKSLLVSG